MDSPARNKSISLAEDSSFSFSFIASGRPNLNTSTRIICKTLYHTIENFGGEIPVQVTEAIRFKDKNASYSANISKEGWAWFVTGRRLFVWQVTDRLHPFGSLCKELSLPPSDLAYKSTLIRVFTAPGQQTVSCVAVSPEGLIRYWPNVANERVSIEDNAELQGQECESLNSIMPLGFIVATTTSTVLLVETNNIAGRHSLFCRLLSVPSGWLGGIGRKMSSLIFGGIPSSPNLATRLVKVLINESGNALTHNTSIGVSSFKIFVITGSTLQKWSILSGEQEKFVYECNLHRLVSNNFLQTIWNSSENESIDISFLDVQLVGSGTATNMMVFMAAVNNTVSSHIHYAFASINVGRDMPPTKINAFYLLRNIDFSVFHRDQRQENIQFLMTGQTVYLHNSKVIVCIPVLGRFEEVDIIDIPDTLLLGATVIHQVPIFFSRAHGFISLVATDISPSDLMVENSETTTVTDPCESIEPVPVEPIQFSKDGSDGLKSAFLHYASKKIGQSKAIVNQIFPIDTGTNPQIDAALDLVTIKVSTDLINDIPAKDPRWAGERNVDGLTISNITSLQIIIQLQQKQSAWELYLSFLKDTGLWKRFTAVTWNGIITATTQVFAEHAEKMVAAIVLRNLQMKDHSEIIEPVINEVVRSNNIKLLSGLTVFDVFYKEVNLIAAGLKQLCTFCYEYVHETHSIQNVVKMILDTNVILLEILHEISTFRSARQNSFNPSSNVMNKFGCELLPWTVAPGKDGLRDSLLSQINVTLKYGIREASSGATKQSLFIQLVSFITIVLEGWEAHVNSVKNKISVYNNLSVRYATERLSLIRLLAEEGELQQATSLAEKFQEFTVLIEIYDKLEDNSKLEYYIEKFQEQNFAKFLFSYYIGKKQAGKLLTLFRLNVKYQHMLKEFLKDYPTLSWIQAVFMDDYELANHVLLTLAIRETQFMRRKKSMLSLSKLAYLAAECNNSPIIDRINNELSLISHHEDLPESVLAAFDHKFEPLRVLLPTDLIKFYICDENTDSLEYSFSKALDLLDFVTDEEEKSDLKQEIWCKAILRDRWPEAVPNVTDVTEYLNEFLFFRIIRLNISIGKDLHSRILTLEKLLETEELNDLNQNATFQYLMKVGYEHYLQRN